MMKVSILLVLLGFPVIAAEKVGGAELPDKVTVAGRELVLNGAGLRKKFVVKVYAGALYLTEKSSDATAILEADEPMLIRMHFLYGVKPEQLTDAWNEGFEASLGENMGAMQDRIDAFNGMFREKTSKGDIYDVVYTPGKGTEVRLNDESLGTVEGLDFKKAVFAIWLGENVRDLKKLKKAMLGG